MARDGATGRPRTATRMPLLWQRFAAAHRERVRFHQWVQWLLDEQLARVAAALPVMHDLPIGVDPNGADAWVWQDLLATDVTVGAPPDEYNTLGQNWGLPPFVPHKLRAAAYQPFRQTIQATLRHAAGLRIDHVMGLFRLFWIPREAEPSTGRLCALSGRRAPGDPRPGELARPGLCGRGGSGDGRSRGAGPAGRPPALIVPAPLV